MQLTSRVSEYNLFNTKQAKVIEMRNSYATVPDDELVQCIQTEKSPEILNQLFNQLVQRYSQRLFYTALTILKDNEQAWDSLQDSFVKIYKKIGKFQAKSSINTWMTRIVVNTALDYRKKQKREQEHNTSFERQAEYQPAALPNFQGDTPEEEFLKKYTTAELKRAINSISEQHRLLLHLKYFDNFALKDIAQIVKMSEGNVKSRLFYARKELRNKVLHLVNTGDLV